MSNSRHLESEQAVIASLLRWDEEVDLTAEDFGDPKHRAIYQAVVDLRHTSQPVDAFTVGEKVGDIPHCMELARSFELVRENVTSYAARVRQHAERRKATDALFEALDKIETEDPQGVIAELTLKLDKQETKRNERNIGEGLGEYVDVLEGRFKSNGLVGLSTGLKNLDERLEGLKPGNLVILAGRPGMGKTTLGLNIATHNAVKDNKSVMFVSLEMPESEITDKVISSVGQIDLSNLLNGSAVSTPEDAPKLCSAVSLVRDKKLRIVQDAYRVHEIRSSALKTKRKQGLDLIVIDYLQLMRGAGDNRVIEITGITAACKRLSRELEVPVILLSQLNRKCEERANRRPMSSDLRESGSIEQDADVIIMVYRDKAYSDESEYGDIAEAIVTKARMGTVGTAYLYADLKKSRFVDGEKPVISEAKKQSKVKSFNEYRAF